MPGDGQQGRDGWSALARGAWSEARASFERAVAADPSARSYEGLSWAAWWALDVEPLFDARREAYRRYRAAGDDVAAARMAIWIGSDYFDFKAELGAANGWFRRAHRLLEDVDSAPEHGWLAAQEAALIFMDRAVTDRCCELGRIAARAGREHGQPDLEMLGLATEGLALVVLGRVAEGMGLIDEATAMALGDELAYSYALPWTYCYLINACEQIHDYERAGQWCRQAAEIAERQGLDHMWGLCRATHAGVLVLQGEWRAAEDELQEAASMLARSRPHWAGEATARLGELRRRQGRLNEAAELFRLVEGEPAALVGLGQIALDRGAPDQACDLAERALRMSARSTLTERAAPLQLLVHARAALGDDAAAEALAELGEVAAAIDTAPLRSMAAYSGGVHARAVGDRDAARRRFEDAVGFADRAGLPYEAARARLELAVVLADTGRRDEAAELAARAERDLGRLGADVESIRAAELADAMPPPQPNPALPRLTPRELEVLGLIARGMGDREIAAELVVSEHTVHRHVANILAKLDVPTRAAAVARAAAAGALTQPTV